MSNHNHERAPTVYRNTESTVTNRQRRGFDAEICSQVQCSGDHRRRTLVYYSILSLPFRGLFSRSKCIFYKLKTMEIPGVVTAQSFLFCFIH